LYATETDALFTFFGSGTKREAILPVPIMPILTIGRFWRSKVDEAP
jgi:hypothetical protein